MTSPTQIAAALRSLVEALPGSCRVTFDVFPSGRAGLSITAKTDEDVRSLADSFGYRVQVITFGEAWWLDAIDHRDGLTTSISGPHHEGTPPAIDDAKLADALDAVKAAADGVSP